MLSLPDRSAMEWAIANTEDPALAHLLKDRLQQSISHGTENLSHYIVIEPGDSEHDVIRATGLTPFVNPINGARFGTTEFHPWWDWLQVSNGWIEMIITVGNEGFAFVLLEKTGSEKGLLGHIHKGNV